MTVKTRLLVNLIAVALLAVVTVGWVLLQLVGIGIGGKPFVVTADFEDSGGVFTAQEVTYRGVVVGKVGELRLNEDGVDVELLIDPQWEGKIPSDSAASIRPKSAVGEQTVNITPREDASEEDSLEDGDEIARSDTSLPVDFQELLKSLDAVLADIPPATTARVISDMADGLGGREEELSTILGALSDLSDAFASVAEEQKSLLDNATTAGSEFLRTKDNFAAAIRAADEVFAGLGDEPEETRRFLAANDRLAREGIELLARSGDDLRAGISALADFTSFQLDEKDSVIQSLEYTPQFLKAIEEASVPWRSPDGRTFYRIRVGLVKADDRERFWPCKYVMPDRYERLPHERTERKVPTGTECVKEEIAEDATTRALIEAIEAYAAQYSTGVDTVSLNFGESAGTVIDVALTWPLNGAITSYFGPRDGRSHAGIDIDGVTGQPVGAAASGVVTTSGYNPGGYGNVVVIDHGGGVSTLYSHLDSLALRVGDAVSAGDVIGTVGCTGRCFGDHVHFEVRINGVAVDPLLYLPGGTLFAGGVPGTDLHTGGVGGAE